MSLEEFDMEEDSTIPEEELDGGHISGENPDDHHIETGHVSQLSGMYETWFLEYASYVILERAVPHINDGLKPVQRRILHAMKQIEDGRFNKVANIIGQTMQYHPHGDASIGDALVQLGQKQIVVDTQGNWGNLLTGDSAAASRYIESRLSKFALDVIFNPKTTSWKLSYDGRKKEPVTLPVKFPLLLAQGVEGIAVGLASKILPHNFVELIDASIAHLQGKSFDLFPDFPTGGFIDVSRYNDGLRGGQVRIRAKISKIDKKTLLISELPFGQTTISIIDSILKANEKGKIKIRKIDDNTSDKVEILVHLMPGIDPDVTIDALYAFTDCETSISPNSCVIRDEKPCFIGVSEILRSNTNHTLTLLSKELQIKLEELAESWHSASLEKIFIENELYEPIKACKTEESILDTIKKGLKPFVKVLHREVTRDDLIKLSNIPIRRISKFSTFKADEYIKSVEADIKETEYYLEHITVYAINYYKQLKKKYAAYRERKTEIRSFDNIEATEVAVANERLYVNRQEGFIGTSLKKDEYVCDCSDIDDIIVIRKDGVYMITRVSDKQFVGKDIEHIAVFRRNDERTIYNIIYRNGPGGPYFIKRCAISGLTRDKEYNLTRGEKGSKLLYLSVNPNGEAERVKINLKPRPRLKNLIVFVNFSDIAIKGKASFGNIITRYPVHKIELKEKGTSTLGGIKIWWSESVKKLNDNGRGLFLGEFENDDKLIVLYRSGEIHISGYELSTHFKDDLLLISKYNPERIYSAVYFDGRLKLYYIKRFSAESIEKSGRYFDEHPGSELIWLSEDKYPRIEIKFGGKHKTKVPQIINVSEFISVKTHKAKGKRLSNYEIASVNGLEPIKAEEVADIIPEETDANIPEEDNNDSGIHKNGEQMSLF